jgi:hypothetical protein
MNWETNPMQKVFASSSLSSAIVISIVGVVVILERAL